MKIIAKRASPNATIVSDRFHVQKLMNEAISDLRVDYRWQEDVEMENGTYFDNCSTNASAESFNAKVKAFRTQFCGIRDISFFIFRLAKLFA